MYSINNKINNNQKNKSILSKIMKAKSIYFVLLPSFVLLSIFQLYPAIKAAQMSLYHWKTSNLFSPIYIGLLNYKYLFQEDVFWASYKNLLIFIVWGFFTTVIVCLSATYLVFKLGNGRWGKLIQRAYVIPMLIPGMVITLYWRFFYDYRNGILNNVLRSINLEDLTHIWLGEYQTALPSLLFMGFPWIGGFAFLIFLAGFQSIDQSLHEAVELDGANGMQTFMHIDLPLIVPQIKIMIVLGMIEGLQQFSIQKIMTNGGPSGATSVPGLVLFKTAFSYGNYGLGSAMGVVLFLLILIITIINNRFIKSRT